MGLDRRWWSLAGWRLDGLALLCLGRAVVVGVFVLFNCCKYFFKCKFLYYFPCLLSN